MPRRTLGGDRKNAERRPRLEVPHDEARQRIQTQIDQGEKLLMLAFQTYKRLTSCRPTYGHGEITTRSFLSSLLTQIRFLASTRIDGLVGALPRTNHSLNPRSWRFASHTARI